MDAFPPKGLRILEAFSASGLRSIRYAKEIVGIENESEPLVIVLKDTSDIKLKMSQDFKIQILY